MTERHETEKIVIDGELVTESPDIDTFLKEAGFNPSKNRIKNLKLKLQQEGINDINQLYGMNKKDIQSIEGMRKSEAQMIYDHAAKLRRKGSVLMSASDLKELESSYRYLQTTSSSLEKMLTYSNGKTGLRSSTLIELYGEASVGKTQMCITCAALCMRSWKKGVVYIDTEGAFEYSRFVYLAKYWGVSEDFVDENLYVSKVHSFDDVEDAILETMKLIRKKNIGLIIVDSIIDALKAQYPLGDGMKNLRPRQQHLKSVVDKMKSMAQMYNIIALYTNQVRASFDNEDGGMVAQGGHTLSHSSDIRIKLDLVSQNDYGIDNKYVDELIENGILKAKATIVDCGFLPNRSGDYLIGPMGIADVTEHNKILAHAKEINDTGYICVNSYGEPIDPIIEEHRKRNHGIGKMKQLLYKT